MGAGRTREQDGKRWSLKSRLALAPELGIRPEAVLGNSLKCQRKELASEISQTACWPRPQMPVQRLAMLRDIASFIPGPAVVSPSMGVPGAHEMRPHCLSLGAVCFSGLQMASPATFPSANWPGLCLMYTFMLVTNTLPTAGPVASLEGGRTP